MVNSISAEIVARRGKTPASGPTTAFLVFDTESVPDGKLLAQVKYPGETLTPEEAIEKARGEARELSRDGSDFLPVTFQVPVAVCVLRVGSDFLPQALACLDAPAFRTPEIVRQFWRGVCFYPRAKLVTFNGRGFDLPLMELAAFDHGCSAKEYYQGRNRYNGNQIDLLDWLTNFGAFRMIGGLNLLARRGRRPAGVGKMEMTGAQVYDLHRAGRLQEINDYCMFDTLDTYFVFLRTRVLLGELSAEQEEQLALRARAWLATKIVTLPALRQYLEKGEEDAEWRGVSRPVCVSPPG
jgi:predicted PolB exonuclease-like 3'-5' exonuclease